jgi:hypothetical protein
MAKLNELIDRAEDLHAIAESNAARLQAVKDMLVQMHDAANEEELRELRLNAAYEARDACGDGGVEDFATELEGLIE